MNGVSVAGIVAEYNPFHLGHQLHIEQTREVLGRDTVIVCCMSGDFVQRGEAAVYSKYARAEAAARSGADLVFELPLPWCLSSAEGFARGAVSLLGGLGIVTHLTFGSECGRVEQLEALARALIDPATNAAIKEELSTGESYATARQTALRKIVGSAADALDSPNNILGVEYIRALCELRLDMNVLTIKREGAAHDSTTGAGSLRSASELRAMIAAGQDVSAFIPENAAAVYVREEDAGRGPVLMNALEPMLLSRLRMLPDEAFNALPDATEGLGNKLRAAVREQAGWDAILGAAKSKRYALARIRRMACCACLGVSAGMNRGVPPYARLLAATERGRELLRNAPKNPELPIITKPAGIKALDMETLAVYNLGVSAHDLYVLAYGPREERRGGGDWRTGPAIV